MVRSPQPHTKMYCGMSSQMSGDYYNIIEGTKSGMWCSMGKDECDGQESMDFWPYPVLKNHNSHSCIYLAIKHCNDFHSCHPKTGIWGYTGHRLRNQTDEDCAIFQFSTILLRVCELMPSVASDSLHTTADYFSYYSLRVSSNQSDQSLLSFFFFKNKPFTHKGFGFDTINSKDFHNSQEISNLWDIQTSLAGRVMSWSLSLHFFFILLNVNIKNILTTKFVVR